MKLLVIGKNGQVASALKDITSDDTIFLSKDELDITNYKSIKESIEKERPDVILNLAAFTNVDNAESFRNEAESVKTFTGPTFSKICKDHLIKLIHLSTDYVLMEKNFPYTPDDITNPLNWYGVTKRKGEIAILNNHPDSIILRTSWLYGEYGNNFLKKILGIAKNDEIKVVNDQFGSPSYTRELSRVLLNIILDYKEGNNIFGIIHYSSGDQLSWYEFAKKIFDIACEEGYIESFPNLISCSSNEFVTQANRPSYSALDNLSTKPLNKSPATTDNSIKLALKNIFSR